MKRAKFLLLTSALAMTSQAAIYEVGPGKTYSKIGAVPWATLNPGDTVLIYWQSTPYREKWAIGRTGTAAAPITVRGVPSSTGVRPIIDGNGAVTPTNLRFLNDNRGVLQIGGTTTPIDIMPEYIVIDGLEVRNGRYPNKFTADDGTSGTYDYRASGIYVVKGRHIIIRNCTIAYNGNGLFISPGSAEPNADFLIEKNFFGYNGYADRSTEHNTYTSAAGIVFQYNRYYLPGGPDATALKDRSAGTVIRYNWIEGGNRQLDLVESTFAPIYSDPRYHETFVYGNTLIEPPNQGNRQITHYGGDNGNALYYRKGTLYFYNNTVVSTRSDLTALFRFSTNDEHCDARNNIFYTTAPGDRILYADIAGRLELHRNWLKPGARTESGYQGTIIDDGSSILGTSPGFYNEADKDYRLIATSLNVDAATLLNPLVLPDHAVLMQYKKHYQGVLRITGGLLDVGAYEKR